MLRNKNDTIYLSYINNKQNNCLIYKLNYDIYINSENPAKLIDIYINSENPAKLIDIFLKQKKFYHLIHQ